MRISDWSSDVCSSDLFLDDAGHGVVTERRHQCLADAERLNDFGDIEPGIGAERLGSRLHRFLVTRRECAQCVLDAIAELPQYAGRQKIGRASWRERVCQ